MQISVFFSSISLLLMAAVVDILLAGCPPGWLAWQDACYILLPDEMDWWQAQKVCNRPGSSLVVPDSQEEHDFIWREMRVRMLELGASSSTTELWIGCSLDNEMTLSCNGVEGDPVYKNWHSSEPDFPNSCARMVDTFGGQWGDRPCTHLKYAACEMHVSRIISFCMPTEAEGQCPPHCLLNHEIRSLTTGVYGCAKECWKEPRCHSFNLWQTKGDDATETCQLNSATRQQAAAEDYTYVGDCYFYEM